VPAGSIPRPTSTRVPYADNDPVVLDGTPQGHTAYIHADLRDPDAVLIGFARTSRRV